MGASQSTLECDANGDAAPRVKRPRSMSPLPGEDDHRNAFDTFDGLDGLPRISSTAPTFASFDRVERRDGFSHIPLIAPAFTYVDEVDGLPRVSSITSSFNASQVDHIDGLPRWPTQPSPAHTNEPMDFEGAQRVSKIRGFVNAEGTNNNEHGALTPPRLRPERQRTSEPKAKKSERCARQVPEAIRIHLADDTNHVPVSRVAPRFGADTVLSPGTQLPQKRKDRNGDSNHSWKQGRGQEALLAQSATESEAESPSVDEGYRKKRAVFEKNTASGDVLDDAEGNEPGPPQSPQFVQAWMEPITVQPEPLLSNLSSGEEDPQQEDLFSNASDCRPDLDTEDSKQDEEQDEVSSSTGALQENSALEGREPEKSDMRLARSGSSLTNGAGSMEVQKDVDMPELRPKAVDDVYNITVAMSEDDGSGLHGNDDCQLPRRGEDNPVNPNDTEVDATSAATPDVSPAKVSGSSNRPKRRAKRPHFSRDGDVSGGALINLPVANGAASSAESQPRRRSFRLRTEAKKPDQLLAVYDFEPEEVIPSQSKKAYRTGLFTPTEERQVREAVEGFRRINNLSQAAVNDLVQESAKTQKNLQLWSQIEDACPTRPRKRLMEWCRQKFHNFVARATWTQEQDDELLRMVRKYGTKWSDIGKLINRHRNDVRDRYNNYLVCGDKLKKDYWSLEEENNLIRIVADQLNPPRSPHKPGTKNKSSQRSDGKSVDWALVSKEMGRTRSRRQCQDKWTQLREQDRIGEQCAAVLPPLSHWRLQRARKELPKMTPHDKFLMLQAILASGKDDDSKLEWKLITKSLSTRSFQPGTLVICWRRLRNMVPDQESLSTVECAQYLCVMHETGRLLEVDDDSVDPREEEQAIDAALPFAEKGRRPRAGQSFSSAVSTDDT